MRSSACSSRFERGKRRHRAGPGQRVLGLTIAKLLTQILGGDLTVISELGEGSTFRVRLMMNPGQGQGRSGQRRPAITGYEGRARRTILIVDDDPSHTGFVEELLTPLGFTVFVGSSGMGMPGAGGALQTPTSSCSISRCRG